MHESLKTLCYIKIPIWIFDVDKQRIHWANDAGLAYWNADSLEALQQRDMSSDMSSSVYNRLLQYQQDCATNQKSYIEQWTVYPNGVPQTADVAFSPYTLPDGRAALLIHLLHERKNVDSNTLHSIQALMHTSAMISLYDEEYQLVYANPASRAVAIKDSWSFIEHFVNHRDIQQIETDLKIGGTCEIESEIETINGKVWHALNIQLSTNAATGGRSILVSAIDVTTRRKAQLEAIAMSYTDSLTGLPNRKALFEKLADLIETCNARNHQLGLIFVDLDRFKIINDSLGHHVGDQLLSAFAKRLRNQINKDDIVARLGGDEFIIVLNNSDRERIRRFINRLQKSLMNEFVVAGHHLRIAPSLGVCVFPEDGTSATELMQHADFAMYAAKTSNDYFRFYDTELGRINKHRLRLESDLSIAIQENQLVLHYQPKISASTGEITGVEALVRWDHPEFGIVRPADFISIAEETGLILLLGLWVMEEAMQQQLNWSKKGYDIPVSINVSPKQLLSPDFCNDVITLLEKIGNNPRMIEFELTESVLIADHQHVLSVMNRLNKFGIQFSLDDFGTGYSNLAYLQKYPLSRLKIDRSFLINMHDTALLELILGMGKIMAMRVVAEGVQTIDQITWLQRHGCDELQGFYFSKPIAIAEWLDYLEHYRSELELFSTAA